MTLAQKYLERLPEDWPVQFLDMYEQGCSDAEVMREFAITPKQWKVLLTSLGESEFEEVVEYGHALARAWWEAQGRVNLMKKGFNVRLYDINMQNRWGWARKAEVEQNEGPVLGADDEALDARIKELKSQVAGDAGTR